MMEIKNQAEQEALAKRLSEMDPKDQAAVMPSLYGFFCGYIAGRESIRENNEAQSA